MGAFASTMKNIHEEHEKINIHSKSPVETGDVSVYVVTSNGTGMNGKGMTTSTFYREDNNRTIF